MRHVAFGVLAAAALASPTWAQETALTEVDARSFVESLTEEARQLAAGEGDIRAWTERNVAEDARIVASGVVLGPGGSVARYDIVAGREEVVRLGSMAMPRNGEPIEGYSLTGEVAHAAPLPGGRIVAAVRFAEAGSFPSASGEQAAAAEALSFESNSVCELTLDRFDDRIKIELAACETTTTM
jgi:hypothetical protein